jgi:hypothetical protein
MCYICYVRSVFKLYAFICSIYYYIICIIYVHNALLNDDDIG